MSAIRTDGLTKDFTVGFWRQRRHRALDHLTLAVEPGEIFGFLGPNGAGKTTTLKLLLQLIFPTSGVAEILGRPAGAIDVRRRIGYLPETPYFYDNLTAEELLLYFAKLFGYRGGERRRRVERLLDAVGVGAERRRVLRRFSKGMLQRVGVAQALVNDPEVVVLDEPMSGLDPIGRRQVRDLIAGLRAGGVTVFFSSHIIADIEVLCDRVAILRRGRLAHLGRLDELRQRMDAAGHLEITVEGAGVAALEDALRKVEGARVSPTPAGARIDVPTEPLVDAALAAARGCGARLVSVQPVRQSLEDLFVEGPRALHAD